MISAIYDLALTTGANRVIRGSRIEHVCGDPDLGAEKDYAYGHADYPDGPAGPVHARCLAQRCSIRWTWRQHRR